MRIRLVQEKYYLYTVLGQTCENAFISFNHTREGNQNIAKLFFEGGGGELEGFATKFLL